MNEQPNWWPKLMRAASEQGLTTGAAVALAEIRHDDGCARLLGMGCCDCDPDVNLASRKLDGDDS